MDIKEQIRESHIEFAESRGLEATYCPSEVARKINPENWRDLMDTVREVADELVDDAVLVVMQKGKIIQDSASNASGPIRLRKK
ncbi:DUF3253 domain-containing protein [Flavimarina sp. Hel_I_48]|uniref:DUF3253 domain-containing protein n=1 Tax=Flavimarina sp. Hel_I_48 TaxID=1392488 RepID=UPI0004DF79AF|nr:DUF3253 domain-containing protein [Flavimarina sp. Hel_I_48]